MIKLYRIGDMPENTMILYIVRSLKESELPEFDFIHVPELSPCQELFDTYKKLKATDNWNRETFNSIYVPNFIRDMKYESSIEKMKYLVDESYKRDIGLFCYCRDETMCHRSIVGGILKGMKANIDCPEEYLKYYRYYVNF